jgi:hypothetical protein
VVGLDHELAPSLAVGVAYTWRRARNLTYYPWLAGACAGEPTAASCSVIGPDRFLANTTVASRGYF